MYNSDKLMEKWGPLLNAESCDPIKDSHRKAVTAVLLENQEQFLREQHAFDNGGMLTESPTNAANAAGASGGFSGGADASGPVAGAPFASSMFSVGGTLTPTTPQTPVTPTTPTAVATAATPAPAGADPQSNQPTTLEPIVIPRPAPAAAAPESADNTGNGGANLPVRNPNASMSLLGGMP